MNSNKLARVLRALVSGDFDVRVPRRRASSNVALFLAGAGTGIMLGMLFTPVSGEQLRSEVSDRAREGLEKAKSTARDFGARQQSSAPAVSPAVSAEKSAS